MVFRMAWDPRQKNRAPLLRDAIGDSDLINIRFSNRPSESSAFRLSTNSSVDVARGLVLLFGLGTKALVWGFLSQAG